jgi:hypothetical protein
MREAEESPMSEAVARECLVKKKQQAGKDLAGAVVICGEWRLPVALQLLVVPGRVYKWSINPFTSSYPTHILLRVTIPYSRTPND